VSLRLRNRITHTLVTVPCSVGSTIVTGTIRVCS